MTIRISTALATIAALAISGQVHAWSECGHHIIAEIAYDLLGPEQQTELLAILAEHPRFTEDFSPPKKVNDVTRWRVGRAGYWPDVARSQPKYNRPSWHYQLGATIVISDTADVNVPDDPGPLPVNATLDTQDLHVSQAINLCRRVLVDTTQPPGDRAIALCWLAHLVADVHQPCHAGSLYVDGIFPNGDRGANSIKTQGGNLHSLWDGLLGRAFNEGDVRRRRLEITENEDRLKLARKLQSNEDSTPEAWVATSRILAQEMTYTSEVMGPILAVKKGIADSIPKLDLSKNYLENAGDVAQTRAAQAGYRLAEVWRACFPGDAGR